MSQSPRDLPVPAEATPQPGQRFLMLPSASSPLARLKDDSDDDNNNNNNDNNDKDNEAINLVKV